MYVVLLQISVHACFIAPTLVAERVIVTNVSPSVRIRILRSVFCHTVYLTLMTTQP